MYSPTTETPASLHGASLRRAACSGASSRSQRLRNPDLPAYDARVDKSPVTSSPDVLSGAPVFAGTRVPVHTLVEYLAAGDTIDEFLAGFPTVSREQVLAFLAQAEELVGAGSRG